MTVYYVHVAISHKECKHCVLQIYTIKNLLKWQCHRRKEKVEELLKSNVALKDVTTICNSWFWTWYQPNIYHKDIIDVFDKNGILLKIR